MLHDFLEIFCEQALATLLPPSGGGALKKKSADAASIRSTLCVELVAKLLHLPHTQLLQRVSRPVLKTAQEHSSTAGFEHPGLVALMHFADRNRNASSLLLPPPPDEDLRGGPPVAGLLDPRGGDEPAFTVRPPEERGRARRSPRAEDDVMSADGRAPAEEQNRPPNRPGPDGGAGGGGGGGYARVASRAAAAELAGKPRQRRPSSEGPREISPLARGGPKGSSPQSEAKGGGYAAKAAAAKPAGRAPRKSSKEDGSPGANKAGKRQQPGKKLPPPDAPLEVDGEPDEEDKELYDKEVALTEEIKT